MKTTIWNAVNAYRAVQQLELCRLDSFGAALRVAQLRRALSDYAATLAKEEEKLLVQYGARLERGKWKMKEPEKQEALCAELEQLHQAMVEIDWTPVCVTIRQADGVLVSARDADALSEFVEVQDGTA